MTPERDAVTRARERLSVRMACSFCIATAKLCPQCDARIDAYRAALLAEVVAVVASEDCAHDLAHTVDDVNPRKTHTGDQADAAIYCKRAMEIMGKEADDGR